MSKQDKEWYKIYYAKNRLKKLAQQKEWAKKNADILTIKRKAYYLKNKEAIAIKDKAYREKNREKVLQRKKEYNLKNRDKIRVKVKKWYEENQDKVKKWRQDNKAYRAEYNKTYQKENRRRLQDYKNERSYNVPAFKLQKVLRARLLGALKKNQKSGSAIDDLGCSVQELRVHLESKFQDGMSWDNHGLKGWHIDHVEPLASFDLNDREQFIRAVHYTNLQPLWSKDNWKKGPKI